MNLVHYQIVVQGLVQGVAFRYYTKLKAEELGLVGTVQNQNDGSVLIHVSGSKEILDQFIQWCHQGSPASKVENLILKSQLNPAFNCFNIIR